MTAELYKIVITPKDDITGLGVAKREIFKAYPYYVKGKIWLTTNPKIAERYNQEELRRIK